MSDEKPPHVHTEIGCLEAMEVLYAYLDGELSEDISIEQVEEHMAHCRSCYSRTQIERALSEHLRETSREQAPTELRSRLRRLMDEL